MAEHLIGPAADFPPGTHRVVKIRNVEIGIFNVGGVLHALPNLCPHQFGPLCRGTTGGTTASSAETGWEFEWVREGEIVTCPWHGIEFDIATGRSLASPKLRVRTYPVTVDAEGVKVTL
ncbi:MAG: Rieske (2Fe-2S) protein [Thermomicrobiales bacterium]